MDWGGGFHVNQLVVGATKVGFSFFMKELKHQRVGAYVENGYGTLDTLNKEFCNLDYKVNSWLY